MLSKGVSEDVYTMADAYDPRARAQAEYEVISEALSRRLMEGSLPPNEAYWWTRVLLWEAAARLADACDAAAHISARETGPPGPALPRADVP
jgi:hypothetical protein